MNYLSTENTVSSLGANQKQEQDSVVQRIKERLEIYMTAQNLMSESMLIVPSLQSLDIKDHYN